MPSSSKDPETASEKLIVHLNGQSFTSLMQLEELAKPILPRMVYDYYAGGSESELTLCDNRAAFSRYTLLPRVMVDVSNIDMSVTLYGCKLAFPVLVAPMALQQMAHPGGELATARAAAKAGTAMVVSTMANYSLQDVAATGADNLFFQVYVLKKRSLTESMVREAERCGYKGVVVTVDAPRLGKRERDEHNRFHVPAHLQLANLLPLKAETGDSAVRPTAYYGSGLEKHFELQIDDSLTWEFVGWLKTITSLPVLVKGVLHPDDAVHALEAGVDGVVVSNHGGRQVDTAPAAVDMLSAVVSAVAGRVPVLVDGGVRRGSDVFKCLALGASAVLLGRPVLYGLALGGEEGAAAVLSLISRELELTMALMGCPTLADIGLHSLLKTRPRL